MATWYTLRPLSRMAWMCFSMPALASASITGPMSTDRRSGLPRRLSAIAPLSISMTRSAESSCRHRTRRAEQRWPALSNADETTSITTCSVRAEESTIIAFWPPVSAISGIGRPWLSRRPAMLRCSKRATSVEPVNITPLTRSSPTRPAPTVSPRPGSSCSTPSGMPASSIRRTA
ncbi:hypothetical protein D3C86_1496180 [compost metagenome]